MTASGEAREGGRAAGALGLASVCWRSGGEGGEGCRRRGTCSLGPAEGRRRRMKRRRSMQSRRGSQLRRGPRAMLRPTSRTASVVLLLWQIVLLPARALPQAESGSNGSGGDGGSGGLFNYEVQKRVHERLSEFMSGPPAITGLTAKYRSNDGFVHGMDARDRDDYLSFCYALMQQFEDVDMIYFALDDGMFLGHARGWGTYREPGESGYRPADDTAAAAKYWGACVNPDTGARENCTLAVGGDHIRCVPDIAGGCSLLELCPGEEGDGESSQRVDCSMGPAGEVGTGCEGEGKVWCRRYDHIESTAEDGLLGYVPRTYYCHDKRGKFTSEECYYRDDETPVDRSSLVGDYAYCGGNGRSCNGTFVGGYRSTHYDPRWRAWYKQAKARQTATWSEPYTFFTDLEMGISFMQQIYSVQNEGGVDERRVFQGVLAVDYSFKVISEFLHQAYHDTSILVAVFEHDEPSFVIGSSTGSKAARKVLVSDNSKPCPEDHPFAECTALRIEMSNLREHPGDALLVRSFLKLKKENFPSNQLLTVRGSGDDGPHVSEGVTVLVQSHIWEQPDSHIKWRIMVAMPSTSSSDVAILRSTEPFFAVVCCIGSFGFVLCLALFGVLYAKRKEPAVLCADFFLTEAFISGCVLLNVSTFTFLGPNTDQLCMLRMWVFHFFFAAALSPLLVKVWRMMKLMNAAKSFRRTQITHRQAAMRTLPVVAVQVVILVVFTISDPPKETVVIKSVEGIMMEETLCSQDSNAFFIAQLSFDAALVFAGCLLSYLTRKLDPIFGEAKQLAAVMYNTAFIGVIIVTLVRTMNIDQTSKILLKAMGIFWGTVFSTSAFVVPRLLHVRDAQVERRVSMELIAKKVNGEKTADTRRSSSAHMKQSRDCFENESKVDVSMECAMAD